MGAEVIGPLVVVAVIIIVSVVNGMVSKDEARLPIRERAHKIAKATWKVVRTAGVVLFAIAACYAAYDWYFNESGWLPRSREVEVLARVSNWVTGELKICVSAATDDKEELKYLTCGNESNESHTLAVKFWGPITTDRDKIWKCQREESSLTCKLQ
jgi:hypothetical protein